MKNKVKPKGNMVEGYALKETLSFCTKYLVDFITIRHRVWDDKEDPSMFDEVIEGGEPPQVMSIEFRNMVHFFVL